MNFGNKLKKLRVDKKINQSEIAIFLNIKQNTYSKYENNINEPDLDTIKKICKYFDVSLNYFEDEENEESSKENRKLDKLFEKYGIFPKDRDLTDQELEELFSEFAEFKKFFSKKK